VNFEHSDKSLELQARVKTFLDEHVLPAEHTFEQQVAANRAAGTPFRTPAVLQDLKKVAREQGLWNLFLPKGHAEGPGLTVLEYAPIAELSGYSAAIAPESMNCSAPDTGNMELMGMFATDEQKQQWLHPLLEAEIRSCFSMTEPDVASSDATNIATTITRDGDSYAIKGRKWWSTGAMRPECKVAIVMGVSNPDAGPYQRHSMILVPLDTPGVTIERSTSVFGYDDGPHGGHGVIDYDCRVPAENLLGPEGGGFMMAQARLGPGRIHHCMRAIGVAERALELMCQRAVSRTTFGQPIAKHGVVQEWIAESRLAIEQARLLVLKTAYLIDTVGASKARTEIAAIKVAAPRAASYVLDRAIQVHGGAGVSGDTMLAEAWAQLRTLHFADGPDEVHLRTIARQEVRSYLPSR
jgi:acyl-CoA dehydrogenase